MVGLLQEGGGRGAFNARACSAVRRGARGRMGHRRVKSAAPSGFSTSDIQASLLPSGVDSWALLSLLKAPPSRCCVPRPHHLPQVLPLGPPRLLLHQPAGASSSPASAVPAPSVSTSAGREAAAAAATSACSATSPSAICYVGVGCANGLERRPWSKAGRGLRHHPLDALHAAGGDRPRGPRGCGLAGP